MTAERPQSFGPLESPELIIAIDLALKAGAIMLNCFDGDQQIQIKGDGTLI